MTNLWVTGTESSWDSLSRTYVQVNPVTGRLLHTDGEWLYIVDLNGEIHRRCYRNCKVLDRKPDEAGPYR